MTLELEALESQAVAVDAQTAANDPAAPTEPQAVKLDSAAEVAALLQTLAALLAPAFPSLATIYTEATCKRLGEAAAPVMDKYSLSVGGLFEKWGAEITLALAALPVGVATVAGIKADLAARRAPPAPDEGAGQGTYAQDRAPDSA